MNWLDLRKIYERSKYREKRKKELRNEVERRFPHLSNRKYVIALAGDRKVEWRPDFIKRTGGSKADMQFECYDIATGEPVSTTVWWTYNGSKSKGDVKGSSGTLHLSAYVPYSSLESVIEQSKEAYYLALRQTQGTIRSDSPDWEPWLGFFLSALQRQMHRLRVKIERERLLMGSLPEVSAQLLDLVRDHGRLTIGDAERLSGQNRNTLKQHFRALVADGHLSLNGAGRGAWYSLR